MEHVPTAQFERQVARLSRSALRDRLHAVRALSAIRGLQFRDDYGRPRTIELAFIPWLLTPPQVRFFHRLAHELVRVLRRLPTLYAHDPAVRRILPFEPEQEAWLRLAGQPQSRPPLAVLGRLDSTATFGHADWRSDFRMLEPNTVAVGGVHYAPTSCSIMLDVLGDVFQQAFPGSRVVPTPDPRRLLMDELNAVAARQGRRLRGVALLENEEFLGGTDEFGQLAEFLRREGLRAVVVDPRHLTLSRGRIMAGDLAIDVIYRDCELIELIEMEASGHRLTALRQAVRQGRLISGLLWEFDHKSAWELLTDPAHARYLTPRQRRLFHVHVAWTRLVRETMTSDPRGRRVDLVRYIARQQAQLVLKPNALYGGEGVVVGRHVTRAVWERTLARALRGRMRYVVQQRASIPAHRFPMLDARGGVRVVERNVVSGFFFNSSDIGLVGRFSENPVVNVSRGGGLLAALVVQ